MLDQPHARHTTHCIISLVLMQINFIYIDKILKDLKISKEIYLEIVNRGMMGGAYGK